MGKHKIKRARKITPDPDMGIMARVGDEHFVLDADRDVVAEIVKALRHANDNKWEFARIPCWVLRSMHDTLTHADLSQRFVGETPSLIVNQVLHPHA
jgi:hypothetical protein